MKKQYQIDKQRAVQQFRRLATEENPNIQMILPLAEIVGLLQDGVGHLLREAGLSLEIARNSVESRRPSTLIGYATAAPFATDFFATVLFSEESSCGIWRNPITLRNCR